MFGVFDGHGGKQAAVYAAKNLFAEVAADLPNHMTSAAERGEGRPDDPKVLDGVPESVLQGWELQDAVVKGLPAALVSGFSSVNEKYIAAQKVWRCHLAVSLSCVVGILHCFAMRAVWTCCDLSVPPSDVDTDGQIAIQRTAICVFFMSYKGCK